MRELLYVLLIRIRQCACCLLGLTENLPGRFDLYRQKNRVFSEEKYLFSVLLRVRRGMRRLSAKTRYWGSVMVPFVQAKTLTFSIRMQLRPSKVK